MTNVTSLSISDEDKALLKEKRIGYAQAVKSYCRLLRENENIDNLIAQYKEILKNSQNTLAKMGSLLIEKLGEQEYKRLINGK